MSTDLDVHPTLLMPSIIDRTVINSRSGSGGGGGGGGVGSLSSSEQRTQQQQKGIISEAAVAVVKKKKDVEVVTVAETEGDEENPITPTSDENKIPAPRSPPPAPRKRRCGVAVACRKKLDFLEQQPQLIIPKDEEIQEFFASSFDQIHSRRLLKRRCPCV